MIRCWKRTLTDKNDYNIVCNFDRECAHFPFIKYLTSFVSAKVSVSSYKVLNAMFVCIYIDALITLPLYLFTHSNESDSCKECWQLFKDDWNAQWYWNYLSNIKLQVFEWLINRIANQCNYHCQAIYLIEYWL